MTEQKYNKNNKLNMPFALFMGPQRSGTSWLYRYFKSREDICLPEEVKELFFFDFNYDLGFDFYFSHFKPKSEHTIAMEVSATYFAHPDAAKRVFDHFGGDIKLVCPLRNPIERSYSLYKHYIRYGLVQGTLQEACEDKPEILVTSHYADHLKNWIDVFGVENIFFCFQEDMAEDQNKYVEEICAYLEVPFVPIEPGIAGYFNVATKPPVQSLASLAQKTAQKLRQLKLYWVINLAKAIGIKALIFGPEQNNSSTVYMSEEDRDYLESKLSNEIGKLEQLIKDPLSKWQKS